MVEESAEDVSQEVSADNA